MAYTADYIPVDYICCQTKRETSQLYIYIYVSIRIFEKITFNRLVLALAGHLSHTRL